MSTAAASTTDTATSVPTAGDTAAAGADHAGDGGTDVSCKAERYVHARVRLVTMNTGLMICTRRYAKKSTSSMVQSVV